MAYTIKALGQAQISDSTPTTIYTVPASTTAVVLDINVCNTTATAATVTIWIDQDGTTADDTTTICKSYSVPANDFFVRVGKIVMTAAATLKAQSDSASAITVTASGIEKT